jgi:NAD-dependent dihydropyrimidine dehydrogenase PreA subunit
MSHLGFNPENQSVEKIGFGHYIIHWLYAHIETKFILKFVDYLLSRQWLTSTPWGKRAMVFIAKASHDLPHGIIITTDAAERAVDYLQSQVGDTQKACFALGPCLCQLATCKWEAPLLKDIQFLYAKDIFLRLKLGYRIIPADEVKQLLRRFHELGYVHALEMCRQSGKWLFCICNCEPRICAPTRVYLHTGEMLWKGPEICQSSPDACVGAASCGKCLERCIFNANRVNAGKVVVNPEKCMGCGLCVSTCPGKARQMITRHDYPHNHIVPAEILLSHAS